METPLSSLISSTPRSARKLIAVDRGITVIDPLPSIFKSLEHLDLTRNQITRLSGLRSLTRLRVLILTDNYVESMGELRHLEPLRDLKEADFTGNPVTDYFGYRDFVVVLCGKLAVLDGEEITDEEAAGAHQRTTQRERLIEAIVGNEEAISKLEHLQRNLKVHEEMISEGLMVEYTPVKIDLLITNLALEWPDSLVSDIRDSLELKIIERISDARRDWQSLYAECLDRQQSFIASLNLSCEQLSANCLSLWTKKANHLRDWSLGPRHSGDLGLSTLGFELDSVLSEHRQLQETTVIQQRQLAAILARNEELEEHLATLKTRNEETAVLHSTIDEGITMVVDRFRDQHRLKKAFDMLMLGSFILRKRKEFKEETIAKQRSEVGTLCFAAWKWATKIEKFLDFRETERHDCLRKHAFRQWMQCVHRSRSISSIITSRHLKHLSRIIQAWSLYPLLARDHRLKLNSAALQYSRQLVLRVLKAWSCSSCQRKPSRYWRDIHSEKLKIRAILALRTKALVTRSMGRRAVLMADIHLARKTLFGLRTFMFLTEKKRQLDARILEFQAKRALKRLRRNQMEQRMVWKGEVRAEQFYIQYRLIAGFRALNVWKELSKERSKRLMRITNRSGNSLAKSAIHQWKRETSVPDFLNHTVSLVIYKRGSLIARQVIKHWKKLSKMHARLCINSHIWQSREKVKCQAKYLSVWLLRTISSMKNRVTECRSETTRLENSLTSRETEVKTLQSSNQKLRFQLDEHTHMQESPETKRTLEELTSRPDIRKVQLLESELSTLRAELSTLRSQRTDRISTEGIKKELSSARTLCTTLTSELQRTTATLQSQQAEFHVQANELTEQLAEARTQLQKLSRENRELKEKARDAEQQKTKDGFFLDLSHTVHSQESSRFNPEQTISPRIGLDSEERRVRQQLESLKRERTAIRGEIESRLRDLEESRSAMSTPGPTLSSLGELSVRLSQLESRMTSRH